MDAPQLAEWLDVPRRTVDDWRYRGGGPRYHKFGALVKYAAEDIAEWLASRAVG